MAGSSSQFKVFGIGLNKTGTSTLAECGRHLGLRCASCDRGLLADCIRGNDWARIKETVARYDLFEDWPWPLIYKEIDQMFPGSKFILTVRESEQAWIESLKTHAMKTHPLNHCRKLVYGFNYPHKHEREHIAFYRQHNDGVRSYFINRESDFTEICWEKGDGFEELCTFLGRDIPDVPLPHANKGAGNRARPVRFVVNSVLRKL